MPIFIDDSISDNFMVGEDGGQYYVDKTDFYTRLKWNSNKILEYMDKKSYSPLEKRIVIRSIARLETLTGNIPAN
jgi:hypothetical protein